MLLNNHMYSKLEPIVYKYFLVMIMYIQFCQMETIKKVMKIKIQRLKYYILDLTKHSK